MAEKKQGLSSNKECRSNQKTPAASTSKETGVGRLKNLTEDFKRFIRNSPRRIIIYFVRGLIIIIPLVVTIWVLVWVFDLLDGMLAPILEWAFGHPVPGLSFAIIITSVVLIGYFGIKFGRRKAFDFFERNVIKIPVVGTIYGSARQILDSFTTTSSSRFLEVIFMEFPRKGIYTVGLVTSEVKDREGKKVLNAFIPTAPNPTSGFLQIVPEADVIRTSMSVSDAMKLIISAGEVSRGDIADMLGQIPEPGSKGKVET
jgi:uncharacterized membrane protein